MRKNVGRRVQISRGPAVGIDSGTARRVWRHWVDFRVGEEALRAFWPRKIAVTWGLLEMPDTRWVRVAIDT
jgi:hypothetical protein